MRGVSAESSGTLVTLLRETVQGGADGYRVADDLFGVAAVLASEPSLRRVLTDVSIAPDAKSGLVREVFSGSLDAASLEVVAAAAGRRWAATRDLGDTLEHLGVIAVVRAADAEGQGDALEDELFAYGRLVSQNPELRDALSDPARASSDKRTLLEGLLAGKVGTGTMRLAAQSTSGFHRTVAVAVAEYQRTAASERRRLVALVRVARPFGEGEEERLARALSAQYDRPVHLNVVVDRHVIGGIRVEVGDDVIDGTIATRLDEARRRLAG